MNHSFFDSIYLIKLASLCSNFKFVVFYLSQQDDYNPHHGGKWSVEDLLFYISSLRGNEASDLLWQEICWVIGKQNIIIFFIKGYYSF